MVEYKHILVALDFSPPDEQILARAISLSRRFDTKLTLFHAVECMQTTYTGDLIMPVVDTELCDELVRRADKRLTELRSQHNLDECDHLVSVGIPKHEILQTARDKGVDLIVMGSHGRHGLQLLLGSTANGVLHAAECDVLAVRLSK